MDRPWLKFYPKGLTRTLDYPQVPIFEFLETSARRYPSKASVIFYGRRISYFELLDSVERFSTYLASVVQKGDRVAIYMQNCPQWIIAYFGILRANAVVVPVNPMLVERELEYILSDSGAKVAVTTSELYQRLAPVTEKLGIEVICGHLADYLPEQPELPVPDFMRFKPEIEKATSWEDAMRERSPPEVLVGSDDLAMIPYTAGTTGLPKGCMHTHATVISNTMGAAFWERVTPASVHLATLPYFHVTGLIHSLLSPVYTSSTIVLLTRWDRNAAIQAIERYRCTHWINITTMVIDLLADPKIAERDLSSLLVVGGGGATMPKAVAEKLEELTGIQYMEGYGLTETISQTHMNPPDRAKLQCLGIPDFGVDAMIIDPDTGEPLPAHEKGELVVRGPEVFKGYWNKPKETEKAFIEINGEKWFRTGDLCYMDEEGYFFIVDRIKRMINRAGFKVWPTEVESVLYQHPAIREVCVIGVPDDRVGEEVKAYVVLEPEYKGKVSADEIIAWSKERMAAYKYPRKVEFVDELPKSGAGKILWRVLQEREWKKEGGG